MNDQEVVEAIRLDCQDELIGGAADDGECGGGESSKSDGSKRQNSGDTDDDLGLGDTEGSGTLEDLPRTPSAEIAKSFGILEAAAEKSRISQATYFLRKAKMAYNAADSNKRAKQSDIRSLQCRPTHKKHLLCKKLSLRFFFKQEVSHKKLRSKEEER